MVGTVHWHIDVFEELVVVIIVRRADEYYLPIQCCAVIGRLRFSSLQKDWKAMLKPKFWSHGK